MHFVMVDVMLHQCHENRIKISIYNPRHGYVVCQEVYSKCRMLGNCTVVQCTTTFCRLWHEANVVFTLYSVPIFDITHTAQITQPLKLKYSNLLIAIDTS